MHLDIIIIKVVCPGRRRGLIVLQDEAWYDPLDYVRTKGLIAVEMHWCCAWSSPYSCTRECVVEFMSS